MSGYKEIALRESCFRPGSTLCPGCMEAVALQNVGRVTDNGRKTVFTLGTSCAEVSTLAFPNVVAWGRDYRPPDEFAKSFSIIHNVFESAPTLAEAARDVSDLLYEHGAIRHPVQVLGAGGVIGDADDCPLATALRAREDVPQQADIVEALAGARHIRAHQADLDRVDVRLDREQARRDLLGGEAADIGEDRHPAPAELRETRNAIAAAAARQAHGVGKRFRFGVADQPRIGMARTGLRHDGADREEAETENGQRGNELAVLVEARR